MSTLTQKALKIRSAALSIGANFILNADSYKTSHPGMIRSDATGYSSYIEARKVDDYTIFAGLQPYVIRYLLIEITEDDIKQAKAFVDAHIGPGVFNESDWNYILNEYGGKIPVTIRAVKEGLKIPTRNILCDIECYDSRLVWLASYMETSLQRAIWYMSTVATNSHKAKDILKRMLHMTSDKSEAINFMLHDFGGRGTTCEEQAQLGGAAHLFNFMGSDTMSGILAANAYYMSEMSAFSVRASEHSIQCAYADDIVNGEAEYFEMMLAQGVPGSIVSIVADGRDVYRFTEMVVTKYVDQIIKSGVKIVLRPDSGDPLEVLPKIYDIIEKALTDKDVVAKYGTLIALNSKHYKTLPVWLGVLQGDGVDNEAMQHILSKLARRGWSSDVIVFGSGGALLQKMNRDTYKFAQKGSAIRIGDDWEDIFKNPITDPGKLSKKGRMNLLYNESTGEYKTVKRDDRIPGDRVNALEVVYENGEIFRLQTLDEIRELTNK